MQFGVKTPIKINPFKKHRFRKIRKTDAFLFYHACQARTTAKTIANIPTTFLIIISGMCRTRIGPT